MSKDSLKLGKGIDWEKLNKVVTSAEGQSKLQGLRRAYDDVSGIIQEKFTNGPQCINWDIYKEELGPNIVNTFEKLVDSLDKAVPDYECEFTDDYRAKHRSLLALAGEKGAESEKKIIAIDNELARIREEKEGLATVTIDEYYSKHPEVGAKIDDEIRNHYWG